MIIKGARVVLKINGLTYIDLDSQMMRAECGMQGGGIVHHAFKIDGGQVVLEFSAEDIEDYREDCCHET